MGVALPTIKSPAGRETPRLWSLSWHPQVH